MITPIPLASSPSTRPISVQASVCESNVAPSLSPLPSDQFVRQATGVRFCSDELTPAPPNLIDQALIRQIDGTTEADKLAATRTQALELFTRFKGDHPALIRHMASQGVAIYTGDQYPGVDDILQNVGAAALVHFPNRLWGKPPHPYDPSEYGERWQKNLMGLYQRAEEDDDILMLLRSNPEGDELLHEMYHVLQAVNGLKPSSGNDACSHTAKEVTGQLLHGLENIQAQTIPTTEPERLVRSIPSNTECQGLVQLTIDAIKQEDADLQEAIRIECRQEADVRQFLSTNADAIGLTFQSPVEAAYNDTEAWMYGELYRALSSPAA